MADRLTQMARPDLHEARAERAAGREHLAFQPAMDGTGTAHVAMDAETFATVHAAIESVTHDVSGRRVASNVDAMPARTLTAQRSTES